MKWRNEGPALLLCLGSRRGLIQPISCGLICAGWLSWVWDHGVRVTGQCYQFGNVGLEFWGWSVRVGVVGFGLRGRRSGVGVPELK